MADKKLGGQTFVLSHPPTLAGYSNVVGVKEGQGPLASSFDFISRDDTFGQKSWEKAETVMQKQALTAALGKVGKSPADLDFLFGGDLLNQCIGTSFAARDLAIPFFGLYGACSTMGESLALAALLLDGGFGQWGAAVVSSHFCSAERQYRTPLEYGGQRTPTAQWTVTGSGAVVLSAQGDGPYLTHITPGVVTDLGVTDTNNMGAAMAPAAYATLSAHFQDTGRGPDWYDLIVTGDLGLLGKELLTDLFSRDGIDLSSNYEDCGVLIFDAKKQDVHCGGSGCGCSASVLTGYLLNGMRDGRWQRMLFCPTGALHSPTSAMQGESIPGICHAVTISTTL